MVYQPNNILYVLDIYATGALYYMGEITVYYMDITTCRYTYSTLQWLGE